MGNIACELKEILVETGDLSQGYSKSQYESSFHSFTNRYKDVFSEIENSYKEALDKEAFATNLAEEFLLEVEGILSALDKKRAKEKLLLDYNFTTVIYIFPGFMQENQESGQMVAEEIAKAWKRHFPTTNLGVSSFEDINAGFKHHFCYITTAVCDSLGKPDDCYELTLLRNYRDQYLLSTEEGTNIVKQYYDVAPSIVKHINKAQNHHEIYAKIWKQYLKSCIMMIEQGKEQDCQKLYSNMVYDLKEKYFA